MMGVQFSEKMERTFFAEANTVLNRPSGIQPANCTASQLVCYC